VISIQKDKANMMGIKLECIYKNQMNKEDNITSLFNKVENAPPQSEPPDSNQSEDEDE